MKKTTLLLFAVFSMSFCFAQSWSTGVVSLDTDFTVQFDVDSSSGLVTMTMIGPSTRWLGVGPGVAAGNTMGNAGDDAVVFNSVGLEDRNMLAGNGQPNLDGSQDWTLVTDNVVGSTRTVVATRAINTGDTNDFVFPTSAGPLPILWAKGGSMTFGYHSGGRGGTVGNLTLSTEDNLTVQNFSLAPNPSSTNFNITLPNTIDTANVEVYNILGKRVLSKKISNTDKNVDVSAWKSGIYLVKVSTNNFTQTKRFVKQ